MSSAVLPFPEVSEELVAKVGRSVVALRLYSLTSIASRSFLGTKASGNLAVVEVVVAIVVVGLLVVAVVVVVGLLVVAVVVVIGLVGAVIVVVVATVVLLHSIYLRPRPLTVELVIAEPLQPYAANASRRRRAAAIASPIVAARGP